MALKEMKTNSDIQLNQDKPDSQNNSDANKLALMDKQLQVELRKLDQKDKEMANNRYIAEVNKN
jgi:hypothetical protein